MMRDPIQALACFVPADGQTVYLYDGAGTRRLIPLAQAADGCYDETGRILFFTRLPFQGSHTKRYQGGTAQNSGDRDGQPEQGLRSRSEAFGSHHQASPLPKLEGAEHGRRGSSGPAPAQSRSTSLRGDNNEARRLVNRESQPGFEDAV